MKRRITRREFLASGLAALAVAPFRPRALGALSEPPSGARTVAAVKPASLRRLARHLKGRLILPADASYDKARLLYNGRFDRHPAMIVRCSEAGDVVRAVEFAQYHTLAVAVRSGGHDNAGSSACDGGMVIDLGGMKTVQLYPKRRSARIGSGLNVSELYHSLERYGFTTASGTCPSVGVGGLTLGGGEGNLLCKYGLACDNLLSAQVVTADGRVLTASSQENSDLFWAVRGGGGNFGIASQFEFRLFAIDRVLAGGFTYPLAQCPDVLRSYREFVASAPDELTTDLIFSPARDGPNLTLEFCYTGDLAEGRRVIEPLRSFGRPLEIEIKAMAPSAAFLSDAEPRGTCILQTGGFIPQLSDPIIEVICSHLRSAPPMFQLGMNELRGAALRADGAFPLRRRGFDSWMGAVWVRPVDATAAIAWLNRIWSDLEPFTNGVYVNRLHDEGEARVRQAYGSNYARLATIKGKYDPDNFFRMNQNIKPAV